MKANRITRTNGSLLGLCLTLTMGLIGCGGGGGGSTAAPADTAVVPTVACRAELYTTWEAQRNCLVTGYRTSVDRCLAITDATRRATCVQLVRQTYGGLDTSIAGADAWGTNWFAYSTAADPLYRGLALNGGLGVDIWARWYQQAALTNYFANTYLAGYNQLATYYWYTPVVYYY